MKKDAVAKANEESFRCELLHLRSQLHLTQLKFAPLLGISPNGLDKIESGRRGAGGPVVLETLRLLTPARREHLAKSILPPDGECPPPPKPPAKKHP